MCPDNSIHYKKASICHSCTVLIPHHYGYRGIVFFQID